MKLRTFDSHWVTYSISVGQTANLISCCSLKYRGESPRMHNEPEILKPARHYRMIGQILGPVHLLLTITGAGLKISCPNNPEMWRLTNKTLTWRLSLSDFKKSVSNLSEILLRYSNKNQWRFKNSLVCTSSGYTHRQFTDIEYATFILVKLVHLHLFQHLAGMMLGWIYISIKCKCVQSVCWEKMLLEQQYVTRP